MGAWARMAGLFAAFRDILYGDCTSVAPHKREWTDSTFDALVHDAGSPRASGIETAAGA